MKTWIERPREVRTLFNPAFCGLVIARGIEGFSGVAARSMPFSLSLLILPLCLHQRTREVFKARTRSYFTKILEDHPEIRVDFAERTKGLHRYTAQDAPGFQIIVTEHANLRDDWFQDSIIETPWTKPPALVPDDWEEKI